MWFLVMVFLAASLWFFPLTAELYWNGRWRLRWLPRVWCGYAAGRKLDRSGKDRRIPARRHPPLAFSLILGRQLLSRLRVRDLRFHFRPGAGEFYCIAGVTAGHIIISILRAAWLYGRRRKRR